MGSAKQTLRLVPFPQAALSRLNSCIVKCYTLGDPVSSLEANPIGQGYGPPLKASGTPVFGSTAIIGSETSCNMGSGDLLSACHQGVGPNLLEDFSLRCCFQTSSAQPTSALALAGWEGSTSTGRLKVIYLTSSTRLQVLEGATTNLVTYTVPTSWAADLGDGAIHDVIVTRGGSNWTLYLDGSSVATSSSAPAADASNVPFTVNKNSDAPSDVSFAQVIHFNRALTSTEVTALWNSGTPLGANT